MARAAKVKPSRPPHGFRALLEAAAFTGPCRDSVVITPGPAPHPGAACLRGAVGESAAAQESKPESRRTPA